jgi:hypothetical protein
VKASILPHEIVGLPQFLLPFRLPESSQCNSCLPQISTQRDGTPSLYSIQENHSQGSHQDGENLEPLERLATTVVYIHMQKVISR